MDSRQGVLGGRSVGIELQKDDTDNGYVVSCGSGPEVQANMSMGALNESLRISSGNTTEKTERQDVPELATCRRVKRRKGIQIETREARSKFKIRTSTQAFLCVENEKIVARRDTNDYFELHQCIANYKSKRVICCMIKWNEYLLQAVDVSSKVQLQLKKIPIDDIKEAGIELFSSFVFKRNSANGLSQSFESLLYRNCFLSCSAADNLEVSNCNPKRAHRMVNTVSIVKVPMTSGMFDLMRVHECDEDHWYHGTSPQHTNDINNDGDDSSDDDSDDSSDDGKGAH